MKTKEFDDRFDAGEDITTQLDLAKARRPSQVCVFYTNHTLTGLLKNSSSGTPCAPTSRTLASG